MNSRNPKESDTGNEGEGSQTGAREYNEATRKFAESGKVPAPANEALRSIRGSIKPELEKAEAAGKARGKGEAPPSRGAR